MRFLLDESADSQLITYLRAWGHDVTAIAIDYPASLPDRQVLALAHAEQRILITNDRDFGELVIVSGQPHAGVILFRLQPRAALSLKVERMEHLLAYHAHQLNRLLVVTADRVRVR
jgi:predicted nuclease of predicted toxin-antitoxin system